MPEKQLSIVPVLSRCPAELLPHSYPGRRAHTYVLPVVVVAAACLRLSLAASFFA